jgi:hypothetical protein
MLLDADFEIEINGEKIRDAVYVDINAKLSPLEIIALQQARAQQIYDAIHSDVTPNQGGQDD